ncbi:MAG: VOC family protein [Acaryochloris sp. RU_4_1]|nr:VOC family protein [Acaryochloris sp. RU_4_1]NJR54808.1 VOC family protein [Acaryochloris sp. CRU_2_0]
MNLVSGINHVAVVTADLDRFIDFYTHIFDMSIVFQETTPNFCHAILRAGSTSLLHAAELPDNVYSSALPEIFQRGHLDHIALSVLTVSSFEVIRHRLLERNVSDGEIADIGPMRCLWFSDPDGMQVEVCLITDATLQGFHQPQPSEAA